MSVAPPLLIRDALLVDPSGPEPHRGDILVIDGRIAAINPAEAPSTAVWEKAHGMLLTPGIVDFGGSRPNPAPAASAASPASR